MSTKEYDVLVVGELNVDIILNQIDGFPEVGKEKLAQKMATTLGSSSAIFASNLSSLGANVAFLGKVGTDTYGDFVLNRLQESAVDTEFILRSTQADTGATLVLNYGEDRAMITYPGAMELLTVNDISDQTLKLARHLHFSSYFLQPGIRPSLGKLLQRAKSLGLTTSLDPQWDPAEQWDFDTAEILPYVDVFLPNEKELLHITETQNLQDALDQVRGTRWLCSSQKG